MYTWILVFTVFLKNRNIISKIKRSKVTDYAALKSYPFSVSIFFIFLLLIQKENNLIFGSLISN